MQNLHDHLMNCDKLVQILANLMAIKVNKINNSASFDA